MNNVEALSNFIKGAVSKQKIARYLGFIGSPKGQVKFLKELDHSLEKVLTENKIKNNITEKEWSESGYLFSSNGVFGESVQNIKAAYEASQWDGGWLLIDSSGKFGILRSEGKMDDELYIRL